MPVWLQLLLALGAFLALAPLVGWLAWRGSRKAKGAFALAAFLGFAMVFDPPSKHQVEAQHRAPEEDEEAGDPPEV
jgi:hypothetical protein